MNESADRLLVTWLEEGPDRGSPEAVERAMAATRRTTQRPGWTIPERWLPMQLAIRPAGVPRPMLYFLAAALLAVALAGVLLFAGSRPPAPPPFGPARNGSILTGAGAELWLADADGTNPHKLAIGLGEAVSPVFSPDGARVTFLTRAPGSKAYSVYVANADGSGARSVTGEMQVNSPSVGGVTWSPDGTKLMLESFDGLVNRIYVVGADGSGLHPITDVTADRRTPAWSPDGSLILYQLTLRDGGTFLAVSNPDGTAERRILASERVDASFRGASWTRDGRIVYFRWAGGTHVIGIVDLDGHERLLSGKYEDSVNPVLSPDDRQVIFGMARGSAIVDIDNPSHRVEIPEGLGECGMSYSPDGTSLLGLGADCTAEYRIPLANPAAAKQLPVPSGEISNATWQRLAP
jgi:WD40 repeat protein